MTNKRLQSNSLASTPILMRAAKPEKSTKPAIVLGIVGCTFYQSEIIQNPSKVLTEPNLGVNELIINRGYTLEYLSVKILC